ncbi:MAG TPA: multiheme c-type cytochrome [Gemmataceae bacterium]|jgi:2',3'-cyclic-nucleotide 2'-phosphodiesterase (5'-nucleotidase family)|nr:multiheme c-type cytochrome [Gemmataceae bacterium]
MRPESGIRVRRLLAGLIAVVAFAIAWIAFFRQEADPPQLTAAPESKVEPQLLFDKWPKGNPDLVIVLTGQMHGYLQKCGCSHPQKGGLERRYNFIESLKARGWEVIGLDVGDVPHPLPYTPTKEQTLAKYETAMQAMKLMGYKATAVGREELAMPLQDALSKYTLQTGNEYPKVLAANIANKKDFPDTNGGSTLTESDIFTTKGGLKVGVIGVAGMEVTNRTIDSSVKFDGNPAAVVAKTLKTWADKSTDVNVLLYQGPIKWTDPTGRKVDATTAAEGFPAFHIVLCKMPENAEADAPDMPTVVNDGKTMICQVGQKGQNVGVIGVFKGPKGTEYFYQRVTMSEEFETPPDKEKGHPILKLLQDYSDTVKDNDYLSEMAKRKKLHSVQALPNHAKAEYVGDAKCVACHKDEMAVWQKTKHAGAYNALAVLAKNPKGRNFDGECIICHTVGYDFKTGFVNQKQTPNLMNVQCESCHGPSSLHVDEETVNLKKNKGQTHAFTMSLSPWKVNGQGAMPSLKRLEAMVKEPDPTKREAILTPAENHTYLAVYQVCYKCHDQDNDPKFKLESYWPNVVHTGLKKK